MEFKRTGLIRYNIIGTTKRQLQVYDHGNFTISFVILPFFRLPLAGIMKGKHKRMLHNLVGCIFIVFLIYFEQIILLCYKLNVLKLQPVNTEASLEWHQGVFLVFFCKMPLWAGSNERCLAHRILKLRFANNRTMFSMLFRQVVKTIKLPVKVNVSNKKNILYHVQLQQLRKIK